MEARNGAGDRWREVTTASDRGFLSLIIYKHRKRSRLWCDRTEVEKNLLAALGIMHQHETISTNITCARECDSQGKADGDSRIHGIAAAAQYVGADF